MPLLPINPLDLSLLAVIGFLVALVLFTLLSAVIFTSLSNLFELRRLRHIPRPDRNAFSLLTTIFRSSPDKTALFFNSIASHTPVMRLSGFLLTTNVIVQSPDGVRAISSMPTKFPKTPNLIRFVRSFAGGSSIFISTGSEHRRLRAVIAPSFRHEYIVQHLQRMFFREARAISTELMQADQLLSAVRVGTVRVIMQACFGVDVLSRDEIDRIGRLYDVALKQSVYLIMLRLFILPRWFPVTWISVEERTREELRKAVCALCERVLRNPDEVPANSLFAQMISMQKQGSEHTIEEQATKTEAKGLFVTVDELVGTVLSFLFAGQATTTLSVSWALYILGQNPDLQRRLHASLISDPSVPSNATDKGVNVTTKDSCLDALDQHALLDAFVKETLRLYPPLNYIIRSVSSDTDGGTTIDGVFLPNGTLVRIPVLALQTRTDIWGPDALQFHPERWMRECSDREVEKQQKWAMCSFWHGSHGCVGQRFAMLETKAFVWEILRQFEIRPAEGSPLLRHSISGNLSGLKVRFVPRTDLKRT